MQRECNKCGTITDDYYKSTPKICRPCVLERNKKWRDKNPNYMKNNSRKMRASSPEWKRLEHLRQRYGITPDDYAEMMERQDGQCLICKNTPADWKGKPLCVDHCHETGIVRGLLCNPCNTGIGLFKEDTKAMKSAIDYLERAYS